MYGESYGGWKRRESTGAASAALAPAASQPAPTASSFNFSRGYAALGTRQEWVRVGGAQDDRHVLQTIPRAATLDELRAGGLWQNVDDPNSEIWQRSINERDPRQVAWYDPRDRAQRATALLGMAGLDWNTVTPEKFVAAFGDQNLSAETISEMEGQLTARAQDFASSERENEMISGAVFAGLTGIGAGIIGGAGAAAGGATKASGISSTAAGGMSEAAMADMLGLSSAADVAAMDTALGLGGAVSGGAASGLSGAAPASKTSGIAGSGITATDAAMVGLSASSFLAPGMPDQPTPEEVPSREEVAREAPRTRTQQMALREQDMSRRATAAGAQRSENKADLLGSSYGTKKRGPARRVLSGY